MAGHSRRFKEVGHLKPKFMLKCGAKLMIEHVFDMFSEYDEYHLILNNTFQKDNDITTFLKSLSPRVKLYFINSHEDGPTSSILKANLNLDKSLPVTVSYCDFTVQWNYELFKREVISYDCCAPYFIGFHAASLGDTKYAYMKESNNLMLELREKESYTSERLNEPASTGIYYFKSYNLFEELAHEVLSSNEVLPNGESYVSLLMNSAVRKDYKVLLFKVNKFICLGTPEDYDQFNYWYKYFYDGRLNEGDIFSDFSMIPMAGEGLRFKKIGYRTIKPIIQIGEESLIEKCLSSLPKANNEIFLLRDEVYKNKKIIDKISNINTHSNKIFISVDKATELAHAY